jgi:hypothetical protein
VFLKDPVVPEAARGGRVTVLEVLGAVNLNNRLYRVHTRRNDRFLRASPDLLRLYPEIDFSQFSFTQHMLHHLYRTEPERFGVVQRALQRTWLRRMRQLLGQLGGKVVLLRLGGQGKCGAGFADRPAATYAGPALVSDAMMDQLRPVVSAVVDIPVQQYGEKFERDGMAYTSLEEAAARCVLGPQVHTVVARALQPVLDRLM